jgi:4-amino-4-deoxy-L-arabinose transferase-like glycosyltransferase
VEHSRLISVDMFVVFFCLLVLYFSVGILRRGRWVDFLLAGVAGGLVVAFKYPGVLVAVIPVAAVLFRRGWRGLLELKLYAGLALIPLVFLLTTPYALLDSQKFLADALYESSHYATGHPGMEGNSPTWYLGFLFQTEGFVALLAVVELLRALVRRERTSLLVGVFPAVYFVFIGSFEVRNDRTILPMLAFLALLAAHLLALVARRIRAVSTPSARWLAWTGYGLLVLALLAVPAYGSVEASSALAQDDGRAQARVWIEQNIPPGAKVVCALCRSGTLRDPGSPSTYRPPGAVVLRQRLRLSGVQRRLVWPLLRRPGALRHRH